MLVDHYAYESEISRLRAALEASERVAMMVDGLISELRAAEEKIVACEKCIGQLREGVRYYGGKDLLDKIEDDEDWEADEVLRRRVRAIVKQALAGRKDG